MPQAVTYDVSIGSQRACSRRSESTRHLLSLAVELGMGGTGGICTVELADAGHPLPLTGAPLTVTLDGGQGACPVFTGEVEWLETLATTQRITAMDGLVKLSRLDVESTYEEVTAGFIVKELMQQAGIEPGTLEKGPKFPSFVLFRGPRALRHIQGLAELCGVDLFTDGNGRAHFAGSGTRGDLHRFGYGEDVHEFCLRQAPPVQDGVVVWGEGAAGSQGADKYYWLAGELSGARGQAALTQSGSITTGTSGKAPATLCSGALRCSDAAEEVARARVKSVAGRGFEGHCSVSGAPSVKPGDRVKIDGLPAHHSAADIFQSNRSLRVRRVRHLMQMTAGFMTRLDF